VNQRRGVVAIFLFHIRGVKGPILGPNAASQFIFILIFLSFQANARLLS